MEKDKKNKSGSGRNKPRKFFFNLDEILATRPNTQLHVVINSSLVHAEISGIASKVDDDQESPKDQDWGILRIVFSALILINCVFTHMSHV